MSQPVPAYSTDSMQSNHVNSSLTGGVAILAGFWTLFDLPTCLF